MGMRRKAREVALQTLYALEFQTVPEEDGHLEMLNLFPEILADMAEENEVDPEQTTFEFADRLISLTLRNRPDIDRRISEHSRNWSFDRLALLDRNLMRVAAAEILFTDTAVAIVIDEAIEIAKKYCSENTGRFINGILNAIAEEKK
jgi:transcription antitermination protein NusB